MSFGDSHSGIGIVLSTGGTCLGSALGKTSVLEGSVASTWWGVPFYWEVSCRSEGGEVSAATSISSGQFLKILSDAQACHIFF